MLREEGHVGPPSLEEHLVVGLHQHTREADGGYDQAKAKKCTLKNGVKKLGCLVIIGGQFVVPYGLHSLPNFRL